MFCLGTKAFGNYQRILGSCIIQVYKSPEQGIASGWFEFSTAKPDHFRSLGSVPGEQVSLPDPTLQKPAVHWQRLVTESITLGQGDVMGIQTRCCPGPLGCLPNMAKHNNGLTPSMACSCTRSRRYLKAHSLSTLKPGAHQRTQFLAW